MSTFETKEQTSAGGVVYRRRGGQAEVALISVGEPALREVEEETGLACEIVAELERVEYWYFSKGGARRVRFHKFVHFYLMRYVSGDVSGHDDEVNEARWVEVEEAEEMLAFKGEKKALAGAREMLAAGAGC